ncbi:MAG: DUF4395 family protein [Gemmatimonadota bacterium]
MASTCPTTFQTRGLEQQGYRYSPRELSQLAWGLRFTPFVCMLAALYGLATAQPAVHLALAALGILPFWFPAWHPVDRLYNHLVRPLWGGVRLPPNPLPRRIACVVGGSMNGAIALCFLGGHLTAAYALGFVLVPLQLVVITTHFCVAAWLWEVGLRALGRWNPTIPAAEARALVTAGARLVDIREPHEFAGGHLPDAINLPLSALPRRLEELRGRPAVLYCQSGMRCQQALRLLRRERLDQVYSLGAMTRWQ